MTDPLVFDVDQDHFRDAVVERSREVSVVVDFWAAWCGPCRVLGPQLERAVEARSGDVVLAKVDVDRNQQLAGAFGVRGIPAVMGFRDGRVAAQFTGAVPVPQIEAFLDQLTPSAADRAVSRGRAALPEDRGTAEASFREALALDPRHRDAAVQLARLVVEHDPAAALELVTPHRPDPGAEEVAARAELARDGQGSVDDLRARVAAAPDDPVARIDLGRALAARGNYEAAIDHLLVAVRAGGEDREKAREQLVTLFRVIGEDQPLVADARRRLASALY